MRAIISHKNKYIYFPIPKVACSTIRKLLAELEGIQYYDVYEGKTKFNYITTIPPEYSSYFKFAFVRNPLDRLVSCYFDKVIGPRNKLNNKAISGGEFRGFKKYKKDFTKISFPDFANLVCSLSEENSNGHFRSQYTFFNINDINFLGRFETLSQDLNKLSFPFKTSIDHLRKTEHENYKKYYDKNLIQKVKIRYKKDIELFNY